MEQVPFGLQDHKSLLSLKMQDLLKRSHRHNPSPLVRRLALEEQPSLWLKCLGAKWSLQAHPRSRQSYQRSF